MEKLKITLTGSLIGANPAQKKTAKALGLSKIGDVTLQSNNACTLGQCKVIAHLIKVENA